MAVSDHRAFQTIEFRTNGSLYIKIYSSEHEKIKIGRGSEKLSVPYVLT